MFRIVSRGEPIEGLRPHVHIAFWTGGVCSSITPALKATGAEVSYLSQAKARDVGIRESDYMTPGHIPSRPFSSDNVVGKWRAPISFEDCDDKQKTIKVFHDFLILADDKNMACDVILGCSFWQSALYAVSQTNRHISMRPTSEVLISAHAQPVKIAITYL